MLAPTGIPIGLIAVSDRASSGIYEDRGIPALEAWLKRALKTPWHALSFVIPDEQEQIESLLIELADRQCCPLILTTGGTGPAPRDVTPEATLNIADKVLPGFGEQMRAVSLHYVPTAILSRQVAVIRKGSLIINLPGQPRAIEQTLNGIFAAVPCCIDLIGGPYLDTHDEVIKAFRPNG